MESRAHDWRDVLARLPSAMAVVPLDDRPFPRALRDPEWQIEAVPDEWPDLADLLKLMLDDEP